MELSQDELNALAATFQQDVIDDAIWLQKRYHYNPTWFLIMVVKFGAVETGCILAHRAAPTAGLLRLRDIGMLDHSIEAYMLKPHYRPLFTADDRARARLSLARLDYHASWDTND